jgi:hypothetical protein
LEIEETLLSGLDIFRHARIKSSQTWQCELAQQHPPGLPGIPAIRFQKLSLKTVNTLSINIFCLPPQQPLVRLPRLEQYICKKNTQHKGEPSCGALAC